MAMTGRARAGRMGGLAEAQGMFGVVGNLDWCRGYTGEYTCQNSLNSALQYVHLIVDQLCQS